MRIPALAWCLVFSFSWGSASAEDLPEALQAQFAQGVKALREGKLDAAEAAFKGVLAAGGGAAFVHNNLGLVYQQSGRHEPAVREFEQAIRRDPAYPAPRILLGASLLALGRREEAQKALERATQLAPREPLARLQLARAYEASSRFADAVEQYRTLRELQPKDPEYAYALGKAYLRLSEATLLELRRLDPKSARLQQALGHNYRLQGKADQALRAFERAAAADPTLPEIHLALAQIHLDEGRPADARREVEKELALVPESAAALALAAQLEAAPPD